MTRIIYIYDTYCGWCYGAAPVVSALQDSGAEVSVMHRHFVRGPKAYRTGVGFSRMALQYDRHIAQLTRRPLSDRCAAKVSGRTDEVLTSGHTAQTAALAHDHGAPALLRDQNGKFEQISITNYYQTPNQLAALAA